MFGIFVGMIEVIERDEETRTFTTWRVVARMPDQLV
jgi:hypothetical protein